MPGEMGKTEDLYRLTSYISVHLLSYNANLYYIEGEGVNDRSANNGIRGYSRYVALCGESVAAKCNFSDEVVSGRPSCARKGLGRIK